VKTCIGRGESVSVIVVSPAIRYLQSYLAWFRYLGSDYIHRSFQNQCKKAAKAMVALILIIYNNYKFWKSKRTRYLRIFEERPLSYTS